LVLADCHLTPEEGAVAVEGSQRNEATRLGGVSTLYPLAWPIGRLLLTWEVHLLSNPGEPALDETSREGLTDSRLILREILKTPDYH
jgi:hypothetical protein